MQPGQAAALVDYFDNHPLHIAEHRLIQSHARLMGRQDVFVAVELHVKEHERQATLNALEMAQHQALNATPPPPQNGPQNGSQGTGGPPASQPGP